MTNEDIVRAWANNHPARTKTLKTDGDDLFSYNLKIGYTQKNGSKVIIDYTKAGGEFYSMTTSSAVGLGKRFANILQNPVTNKKSTII